MKKLFVSIPMRDRTPEDIQETYVRMHKIAEGAFGEELELIHTNLTSEYWDSNPIERFGEVCKRMQSADYFIYIAEPKYYKEHQKRYNPRKIMNKFIWNDDISYLEIEQMIAHKEGIPSIGIPDDWFKDILEKNNAWDDLERQIQLEVANEELNNERDVLRSAVHGRD